MSDNHEAVRVLAARQHGLVHRRQLAKLGVSRAAFRNLLAQGLCQSRSSTVFEIGGAPRTDAQDLMLAVLDAGVDAAISHDTAFARWGAPGFAVRPIHVTGTRHHRRYHSPTIGTLHEPRLLLPEHVLVLDGMPTTSPTRTLFDLAAVVHPGRLERALDNALASGLTSIPLLNQMLRQLGKKGRPGITVMRALLEARPVDYVPPASGLESRFHQIARKADWWTFVRQVNVGDEHSWLARVDFVDREHRVIVEVQSTRFHTALLDRQADRRRIALLRAAGWIVHEVTEHDLWHNPVKVIRDLWNLRHGRPPVPPSRTPSA